MSNDYFSCEGLIHVYNESLLEHVESIMVSKWPEKQLAFVVLHVKEERLVSVCAAIFKEQHKLTQTRIGRKVGVPMHN